MSRGNGETPVSPSMGMRGFGHWLPVNRKREATEAGERRLTRSPGRTGGPVEWQMACWAGLADYWLAAWPGLARMYV